MAQTTSGSGSSRRSIVDNMHDDDGIGDRFLDGFSQFVARKKQQAVLEVLTDEFPHLAQNANMVNQVLARLGDDAFTEKRFVFLVMNPQYKGNTPAC